MKHLLIILSFLLLSSPVIGQSERPETIIVPVSSMGDVSDTRKQILENTLTNELKKHFRIVPQEKYEQVLEQVFEELEYEECSEDTCIMRVQEMLQVENVFNLQIIGEGKDSQLNLKWITLDEKRNEEDYCRSCGTFELREMIGGLVEKLVGEKRVEVVVEKKPVVVVKKKPIVVVEKKEKGVLYFVIRNGEYGWYESGNEKEDWKYVGEIEYGVPNGQGTLTKPNGDKYVGEFKDGKKNGQGTYTWSDGNMYVGEFQDGERNGQGTYTFTDGRKFVGEYKDRKRWKGSLYDKEGKIIGGYVDGDWGFYVNGKWYRVDRDGNIIDKVRDKDGTPHYNVIDKDGNIKGTLEEGKWKDGKPIKQ